MHCFFITGTKNAISNDLENGAHEYEDVDFDGPRHKIIIKEDEHNKLMKEYVYMKVIQNNIP